jgi:hypothetical protein
MKLTITSFLLFICSFISAQNNLCENWETKFDIPPFFGDCDNPLSEYEFCTIDNLHDFLNDRGYGEYIFSDFDPTRDNIAIHLTLRINTQGAVSIFKHFIEGDFPKELEELAL